MPVARSVRLVVLVAAALLATPLLARADDYQPPADGKLTDEQLVNYIAARKDQTAAIKAGAAGADAATTAAAKMAIAMRMSQKVDAAPADHHLAKAEFDWIDGVCGKTTMVALFQMQWDEKAKPDLEKQIGVQTVAATSAREQVAAYEKVDAAGRRAMTPAEREAAIKAAADDRAAAKTALADAQSNGSDAAAVDAAKARLSAADAKFANPDVPVTDDEKASAKTDNAAKIAAAKAAAEAADAAVAALKDTLTAGSPQLAAVMQGPAEDRPLAENVALIRKHLKDLFAANGMEKMLDEK